MCRAGTRQLGRVACPLPVIDGFVASRLLPDRTGTKSGADRIAVAVTPAADTVGHVELAGAATHALLLSIEGGTAALREISSAEQQPGLAVPAWSSVRLGATTATADISAEAAEESILLVRLGLAARALAAAGRAHEMAVEHARQRYQFGRPIGSFGAVQQRAASCQIDLGAGNLLLEQTQRRWGESSDDWTQRGNSLWSTPARRRSGFSSASSTPRPPTGASRSAPHRWPSTDFVSIVRPSVRAGYGIVAVIAQDPILNRERARGAFRWDAG